MRWILSRIRALTALRARLAWVLELATSAAEPGRYAELREDRIALLFEALDPAEVVEGASFFQIFFDRLHPRPELASRAVVEHVIAANGAPQRVPLRA